MMRTAFVKKCAHHVVLKHSVQFLHLDDFFERGIVLHSHVFNLVGASARRALHGAVFRAQRRELDLKQLERVLLVAQLDFAAKNILKILKENGQKN